MTIGERWAGVLGRPSGFDYMRVALATAVVTWHSYGLTYGIASANAVFLSPTGWLLQLILPCFFALSGFLVSGSLYRNPNIMTFLSLRTIRIFPALVMEVILSAFILGPAVTTVSIHEYFTSRMFFAYLLNTIGYIHYVLPGVFLKNVVPSVVNFQLWTVPFELECYLLITVLALIGMFALRKRVIPLFVICTVVIGIWNKLTHVTMIQDGHLAGRNLVLCFFAGIVIYSYRDCLPWRRSWALTALVLSITLLQVGHGAGYLMPIFASYLTVYLGLTNPKRTVLINSGDYSYGVYLYGGPIQQTVAMLLATKGTMLLNLAIALPITTVFALFSWWCVEKPFLTLRRFLLAKPSPAPSKADVGYAQSDRTLPRTQT